MTAYTDIIPLETAKLYLKIDPFQTSTDDEITAMINSACRYIEARTNWIFFVRSRQYFGTDYVAVYDYPINTPPADTVQKQNYSLVPTVDGEVTLNVGAQIVAEIPEPLLDCALQIINFWFYNKETDGAENSIPNFVVQNIDTFRRFI